MHLANQWRKLPHVLLLFIKLIEEINEKASFSTTQCLKRIELSEFAKSGKVEWTWTIICRAWRLEIQNIGAVQYHTRATSSIEGGKYRVVSRIPKLCKKFIFLLERKVYWRVLADFNRMQNRTKKSAPSQINKICQMERMCDEYASQLKWRVWQCFALRCHRIIVKIDYHILQY